MHGLFTDLEATVGSYELRSYGGEQKDRQGDPSLSNLSHFGNLSGWHLRGMTHKTNLHLLNMQGASRDATVEPRGSVAASIM